MYVYTWQTKDEKDENSNDFVGIWWIIGINSDWSFLFIYMRWCMFCWRNWPFFFSLYQTQFMVKWGGNSAAGLVMFWLNIFFLCIKKSNEILSSERFLKVRILNVSKFDFSLSLPPFYVYTIKSGYCKTACSNQKVGKKIIELEKTQSTICRHFSMYFLFYISFLIILSNIQRWKCTFIAHSVFFSGNIIYRWSIS